MYNQVPEMRFESYEKRLSVIEDMQPLRSILVHFKRRATFSIITKSTDRKIS